MKTILFGLMVMALTSGCASMGVVDRDHESLTVCCKNNFCGPDNLEEFATTSCGGRVSWARSFTRDSGAQVRQAFGTVYVQNTEADCVKYYCHHDRAPSSK